MKWFISGGCGFLGSSLVANLVQEGGHTIRVLDNLTVGARDSINSSGCYRETDPSELAPMAEEGGVELVVGDILDADLTLRAACGADVIVHLAANTGVAPSVEDPRSDCVTNVLGTLNLLEAARHGKVGRFVFASSGAPVGEVEPPIHEELVPHPVSPYGASKLAGEGYCSAYHRTFGVETVALRFGNVYGPRSDHKGSAVAKFIRLALAGEVLEIYGDGGQTRDFIYIDDLVEAVRKAATVPGIGGEVFQIATNAETTILEMVQRLEDVLFEKGVGQIRTSHGPSRLGDVRRNYSDTSKARELLGWTARVDLDDGMRRSVKWFLNGASAPQEATR